MENPISEDDSGFVDCDHLSPLRPTKYEHEHISRLQVFSDDLQKAIQTSFPRAAHPYVAVTVLLLRWTDDDLSIQVELDRLRDVFEFQFRFATEQWNIPSFNPTRALQAKLYDFQEAHQSESELLIVYYGGHGEASRRGKSVWAARSDSPTLAWSSLQHLLENAIPHVLIILDCCFAANAARDTAERSTKEILAACGRENPTTGVGHRSFTSALIEELHAFGSNPFTVAMLHSRLVTMRWRLQFTPIYALLSEHGGNSIHLAPLPIPKVLGPHASLQGHGDYALGDDPMDLSSNDNSPFSDSPQQSSQSSVTAGLETRVLLAVSIQQDLDAAHDVSQWVSWLTTQAPWDVTKVEVTVEGAYESHSTLVLVSIPIYAWDGLPDKEAYRFIDFVKSSNLQQPRKSSRLASRALSASNLTKENKLFPPVSVSRYKSTKRLELSAEEPKVALQKYHQNITKHGKDETAVTRAVTEWAVDGDGVTTANIADVYSNAEVDENSHDALAYPTPGEDLDKVQTFMSSSVDDLASTDSKPVQSKARSADQSNLWIAKSGPSGPVTNHSAGRSIAKGDARSKTHRSQPYPRSSTLAAIEANRFAGPWSALDDEHLMQARQRGMNWAPIAQEFFPRRSADACRRRHEKIMDGISTSEDWAPPKLEEMAKLYLDLRKQMWSLMAYRLGESWWKVEDKCMEKGLKMLRSTVRPRDATTGIEECFVNISSDDDSFGDSGYHDGGSHDSGLCLDPY